MTAENVRKLAASLDVQPGQMDIHRLFPMFAPARFFSTGRWPGPFELLGAADIGLTWALDLPDGAGHRYLDEAMRKHWDGKGVDWRQAALDNITAATPALFTHELGRKDGSGIFAGAMMHPDGRGPSRLLLRDALRKVFPEGYRVAIPEMSCGVVVSKRINPEEEAAVTGIVAGCFTKGTRPLSGGIFDADALEPAIAR